MEVLPTIETRDFVTLKLQAPRSQPKADVVVQLVLDDQIRTDYNTANGTNYLQLPANAYTIPSLTVTIPKDNPKEITIPITINKANMNLSNQYALGVRIQSISEGTLNINEEELLVTFLLKNKYDGIYGFISGFVQRYSAPGVPICCDGLTGPLGPVNSDVEFVTVGANTVQILGLRWSNDVGVAGIDGLTATVDPGTNLVTMASAQNATLTNWAGHPNYYDPVTKRFYLAFRWNPAGATREYEVIFQYERPRP
jgi:hypothetical protein